MNAHLRQVNTSAAVQLIDTDDWRFMRQRSWMRGLPAVLSDDAEVSQQHEEEGYCKAGENEISDDPSGVCFAPGIVLPRRADGTALGTQPLDQRPSASRARLGGDHANQDGTRLAQKATKI